MTRAKLSPEAIEKVRREWGPWSRTLTTQPDYAEAATEVAIAALEAGLPADGVAAMIRLRAGISSGYADNRSRVLWELGHYERARQEAREMGALGLISSEAAAAIELDYAARSAALSTWSESLRPRSDAATAPASPPVQGQSAGQTTGAQLPAPAAVPAAPARPSISFPHLIPKKKI